MAYHLGIKIGEIVVSQDPAYVSIQDQPKEMRWQYLLFYAIGNVCSPETFDFIYPSMGHGKEE